MSHYVHHKKKKKPLCDISVGWCTQKISYAVALLSLNAVVCCPNFQFSLFKHQKVQA